jgi:hypothetical protein
MSFDIDQARTRLRAEVAVLEESRRRFAGLREAIPPSAQETSEEDLDGNLDVSTEIRSVIAIQLADRLDPLIRALLAAAEYQPKPAAAEPASVPLDLTQGEETMGRVVRALVVEDWFTERADEGAPGGVWRPPGTPEQAELQVFKAWGSWFATWRRLDVPADAPEAERWERLSIEEHPLRPGALSYHDF